MRRLQAVLTLGAVFLAVAAPVGGSSLAQRVGVPEWTSQVAVGQPPEAELRRLVPGLPMQFREAVSTDERGAADFIFNNSSRLLVGPDCGLTLDERFYDPELDLDVVRASMRTDTFCVTRVDRVRALRADGDGPGEAETGSMAAVVGEGAAAIDGGGAVLALQFETATLVMVDTDALIAAGAPGEGLRAFKTSSEGALHVFAGDSSLVLRRADFDAQVTPDGRLVGPNRTDPAVLKAAQRRLQGIEPVAVQRVDLPYVLEPLALARLQLERPARERPDHCLLTDTCIGFERVVEFDEEQVGPGDDIVQ